MVLDISKTSNSDRDAKLAAAKGAAITSLQTVYAEDLHLLPAAVDEFIEDVVTWTEKKYGNEEVLTAREEFFWKYGKVFDDDSFFHERMTFFLDFFVFLRPIVKLMQADSELTPYVAYKTIHTPGDVETRKAAPMTGIVHSLFEVLKTSDHELLVQDCITKDRHVVRSRGDQKFRGVARKNIFQGCLYMQKDGNTMSLGCIFHPPESWRILKKVVKRLTKAQNVDLNKELSDLAKTNLKSMRHPHVDPKRIYGELLNPLKSAGSAV